MTPDTRLVPDADAMRAGRAILDAHGQWEIENNRLGGQNPWQSAHLMLLGRAALSTLSAAPALPAAEAVENVVAWNRTADKTPEPGHKFVALYDDGSGAWLGFMHDGGVIDSDGDDYKKMGSAEWWTYLPTGFRLFCEDHPVEDFQLPEHVCPPLTHPAPDASPCPAICQSCGGAIEGWICQGCDLEFRENGDGELIVDRELSAPDASALREAAKTALLVLSHLPDSVIDQMNVNARKDLVFATDGLRAALSQGEA